jgi:hypothetical protein
VRRRTLATAVLLALCGSQEIHAGTGAVEVDVGTVEGGGWTPGGFLIASRYLRRLDAHDWLVLSVASIVGGGGSGCSYDDSNVYGCTHGFADGDAFRASVGLRHFLGTEGSPAPFLGGGVIAGVAYFPDDVVVTMTNSMKPAMSSTGVTGLVLAVHGEAGLSLPLSSATSVIAVVDIDVGLSAFQGASTIEPQLAFELAVGVEHRL